MTLRVGPIGSSSSATTIPGWNDYELMRIEKEILAAGIIDTAGGALEVTERGAGANMTVDVAAGVALIEITNTNLTHGETYKVWFTSDATESVSVPTADGTHPRIDIIVASVDVSIDPDGNAANIADIELIEGTPGAVPSAPATPANSIKLAEVTVPASDTAITNSQIVDSRVDLKLQSDKLLDVQREATALTTTRCQLANAAELTIATGAITVTQPYHKVDTEGDAASDDLATITAGYGAGEIVVLFAANDGRTVVIKNGTGNIYTSDGADFEIDDDDKSMTLIYDGTNWKELSRGRAAIDTTPNPNGPLPQAGSIVARWKLDEASGNRADSVGANTLTDNNSVLSGEGINQMCAYSQYAADFEATNSEYLSIADNAALSITGDMTIALWVNVESAPGAEMALVGKDATGGQLAYQFYYMEDTGKKLKFRIWTATAASIVSVAKDLTVGTWFHIAMVYDASAGSCAFYSNGVQISTTQTGLGTSIDDTTSAFEIGRRQGASYFDGMMQDVIVWTYALSAAEIRTLYLLYTSGCQPALPTLSS